MDNVTFIIKTFERPKALDHLIKSMKRFYPTIPILVADDSKNPFPRDDVACFHLAYNVGISAGRNFLLNKVTSKYVVLFDDDFVCTENTKIEEMIDIMEHNPIDLVGGDVINEGKTRWMYHGVLEFKDGFFFNYIGKDKGALGDYPLYDIVTNFFAAKTEKVRNVLWDENLKTAREHADFFLRCRDMMTITRSPKFSVDHFQGKKLYLGKRGKPFIRYFNKKWNIIGNIELREHENPIRNSLKKIICRYKIIKMKTVRQLSLWGRKQGYS